MIEALKLPSLSVDQPDRRIIRHTLGIRDGGREWVAVAVNQLKCWYCYSTSKVCSLLLESIKMLATCHGI